MLVLTHWEGKKREDRFANINIGYHQASDGQKMF